MKTKTLKINFEFINVLQQAFLDRMGKKYIDDWSETDWGCALAGEVGELCNKLKKRLRENFKQLPCKKAKSSREDCAKEMADILSYLVILSIKMDINLGKVTADKFNEVSRRKKSKVKITYG